MFGSGEADEIRKLFASSLGSGQVAFMYLGYSGVIMRTSNHTIIIDPSDLLKDEQIKDLRGVDLLLFTHSHGDHYKAGAALSILRSTGAHVMAEPLVADNLEEKIPSDKLTIAEPEQTYTVVGITVSAVRGVHRGPINLYHIKIGDLSVFHAGDSGYVSVKDYPADLAFLPTGRPSPTASPEHAFKMASELKPRIVVTIHGSPGQSREFKRKMREKMPGSTVMIPKTYKLEVISV